MSDAIPPTKSADADGNAGAGARPPTTDAPRVELDDSDVTAVYANICRVASTPEEVILDLALNPNPLNSSGDKIRVSQRVILNHYTAKRLAALLAASVQRHEKVFGVLETDIRKRVKSQ